MHWPDEPHDQTAKRVRRQDLHAGRLFFLDAPPVENIPIPDFRTVGDKEIGRGVSADLLDIVYVCQARQEWYRDNQLLNGKAPLLFVGSASLTTPVAEAAEQMRNVLDWSAATRHGLGVGRRH